MSLTPSPVTAEYAARLDEIATLGPMHVTFPELEYRRREASHARLAAFLGVRSADFALVRGVSEAYQTVLRGIDWRRGDELIISSDEEGALLLPSLHLRQARGVRLVFLPVGLDPDQLAGELDARIGPRTRLMAVSHVTTNLGVRLPVAAMTAVACRRGILSFVDVAHSAGLFDFALSELGADAVGALSYKWMYGPYAAGCLWVRRDAVPRIALRFAGNRSEQHLDEARLRYRLRPTADRFEYGPWAWPLVHAWARAAAYVDSLGRSAIWARTCLLTARLKSGLGAIDGVHVLTPVDPSRSAALVTFAIDGVSGEALSHEMRTAYNIHIKHVPTLPNALRASIAFFTSEDEVDLLLGAIRDIVGSSVAPGDESQQQRASSRVVIPCRVAPHRGSSGGAVAGGRSR